jgi:MSHA biogenesis protein MshQ
LIQPTGGGDITLSFTAFNYENGYDNLYVYDGTSASGTLLDTLTGTSIPSDLTATSGAMYITHDTDYSITRSGFGATWSNSRGITAPVVEWHFDEESWDGSSDEVVDNQGVLSGFSVNGASTNSEGQVCGSASFDGVDDYLSVTGIDTYLKTTSSLSFWIKTSQSGNDTHWAAPGITGIEVGGGSDDIFWGWLTANGRIAVNKGNREDARSLSSINVNTWQHVVLTRDASNGTLQVFINGILKDEYVGISGDVGTAFSSIGRIEDTYGTPEYFAGNLDELLIFDSVIDSATVEAIYNNQLAGKGWDGYIRSCSLEPIAEWRFEDDAWNGSSDEVIDSSGNDYHGQLVANASPANSDLAISGSVGTCDYGSFSAGSIAVDGLPVSTSDGSKTTVAFWMNWDGTSSAMPIGWSYYDLWFSSGSFGFNTWNIDIYGMSSSSLSGAWHHITAEFTNGSNAVSSNRLWVDGIEQTLTQRKGSPSSAYRSVGSDLRIGGASNSSYYHFSGSLDEVKIYNGSLTTTQIQTVMNETHPCSSSVPGYFSLNHDASALYCSSEPISVSVHNSDTSVMSTYADTITLDTQTGLGTWSLASGNGTLIDSVSNDGLATYTFADSDNGTASFALYYVEGASTINIDVYDADARDNDSEGDLVFSPTGFTITASPLANPPITPINDPVATQISGQAFSVAITAYGIEPESGQCGIIETYDGSKTLSLATSYMNPTTGTLSASGSGAVNFSNGQGVLSTQYNDVGQISISVADITSALSGQSNNFVVTPDDFSISVVGNPATTSSGSGLIAAGEPFTIDVQALNALGDPTPNYGNEQVPESVAVTIDSLVFPVGGNIGVLSNGNGFSKVASNTFQNTSTSWNEVGSLRLAVSVADNDYLGVGNIASTASGTVGRFYPESFFLGSESVSNSCSNFTYLSQPDLSINYTLSAITSDGSTVSNYDSGLSYPVGSISYHVELNNDGNNLASRLSVASVDWSGGEYSITDDSAIFARGSNREAPLSNLILGVSVDDIDNRLMYSADLNAANADDCVASANCTAMTIGEASFYYGRLSLADTYGPETAVLPAKLVTEYWDGVKFIANVYDNCTLLPRNVVSFDGNAVEDIDDLSINLAGGVTEAQFDALDSSNVGFISGDAGLHFSAPGTSITIKSFMVDIDLSTIDWLRFDWDQDGNDNNDPVLPTATMSFKTYRGHDRILYWRHRY